MRRLVAWGFGAAAVVALGWGVAVWLTGGLNFTVAGFHVRSTNYWRPTGAGMVAAFLAAVVNGWRKSRDDLSRIGSSITPGRAAAALALTTTILSLTGSSWTASGPDSFAYVSQAGMWRDGRLSVPIELAADAPWPAAPATFAPFGYRAVPGNVPALVPVTAPGLPLTMAALQTIGGHCAAFLVTPIAGGALVLLTFAVGRRLVSPVAGLIAAWLVATSPALLFMLMWPMSDVPAAAWATAMVALLMAHSPAAALGAGLAASAAILTRTTLATVIVAAGLWLLISSRQLASSSSFHGPVVAAVPTSARTGLWRIALFVLGLLPGAIAAAWLNTQWYGSALASGYGSADELFSASRAGRNAMNYVGWLAETSPIALLGLAGLAWPARRLWPASQSSRDVLLLGLVAAAAIGPYLFYLSYEHWWYLRFLLPAWPALFIGAAAVLESVRRRGRFASAAVALVVMASGLFGIQSAHARGVFEIGAEERRYVSVARLIETTTEPDAVILTGLHAGTLRYYAGRDTIRFDVLDPAWLDRAVTWLDSRGRHPYILVEDWEHPLFNARYGRANALGHLAFTPALAWQSTRVRGWVFLYDPLRRDRPTLRPGPELERDQRMCAAPADRTGPR